MSALVSYSPETAARHAIAVDSMILTGFTVLIYDHILTFVHEVELIWSAPIGLVSVIFIANRYLVPSILVIDIYENFYRAQDHSLAFCKAWTILQGYLTIFSYMSLHFIVALRVLAMYGGRRYIKHMLWIGGFLYAASTTTIISMAQAPLLARLNLQRDTCVGSIPPYLWAAWLPTVVFETFLFILTVRSAVSQLGEGSGFGALYTLLFRDGILYFLAVAFCSMFSLIVWAVAGPTLFGLARYFAVAMVTVAGSRLVLNLKVYASSQSVQISGANAHIPMKDFPIPTASRRDSDLQPIRSTSGYRREDMRASPIMVRVETYTIGHAI